MTLMTSMILMITLITMMVMTTMTMMLAHEKNDDVDIADDKGAVDNDETDNENLIFD